jgi:hypothetical protein
MRINAGSGIQNALGKYEKRLRISRNRTPHAEKFIGLLFHYRNAINAMEKSLPIPGLLDNSKNLKLRSPGVSVGNDAGLDTPGAARCLFASSFRNTP